MSSPWGKITAPIETMNFAEIMSEEYAHRVQNKEIKKYEKLCEEAERKKRLEEEQTVKKKKTQSLPIWENDNNAPMANVKACTTGENDGACAVSYSDAAKFGSHMEDDENWQEVFKQEARAALAQGEELPAELVAFLQSDTNEIDEIDIAFEPAIVADEEEKVCDSDEVIAMMLQSQFDHEYNEELRRIEEKRNKQSKVSISLDKFRRNGDMEFLNEPDAYEDEEDEIARMKRDWDRFETNDKKLDAIPKCGFRVDEEGDIVTKHDEELCGVRNAGRVMNFPYEFATGDSASFEMKLSNRVYNQLKTYSHRHNGKKHRMGDRKENESTAEMGVDAPTRLLLYKLINNKVLEQINGIISTGKEAVILHANSDPSYTGTDSNGHGINGARCPPHLLPHECAIKIFKTTLNEFKQRDRYIKDDYRFKDRFSKQNNRVIINMWAEKEMHNLMRMQSVGINCPDVVVLKKHVLVMSFIGKNNVAAPKLKDAQLNAAELSCAYEEIVTMMYKLFNEAKLVHADCSEYNILWFEGKCWFIDVAQSVEPEHPSALEFLMRDCGNIVNFFSKRGLPNIFTKEQLFEHISSLNAEDHNVAMLERIHTRGASIFEATAPNQEQCPDELKPLEYPFDVAWEKSQLDKEKKRENALVTRTTKALKDLSVDCKNTPMECENEVKLDTTLVAASSKH